MIRRTAMVSLLCAFAVVPASAQESGMPPALVRVAEASMRTLAPVTQVSGTVVSRNDARLAAEVDGRLVSVAEVGAIVARGDEAARIEALIRAAREDGDDDA